MNMARMLIMAMAATATDALIEAAIPEPDLERRTQARVRRVGARVERAAAKRARRAARRVEEGRCT